MPRKVRLFGDRALLASTSSAAEAHGVAWRLAAEGRQMIEEVVVGDRSVGVVADPRFADLEQIASELESLKPTPLPPRSPRRHEVPVAFDGADLEEVARLAGFDPAQVIRNLTGLDLLVDFLGFSPGFAYLSGLPDELRAIPRRSSPRASVSAGSLAIAGGFAAIYPVRSPGGWQLLGRTEMTLFDPEIPPYALFQPGDSVRVVAADLAVPSAHDEGSRPRREPLVTSAPRALSVERPGLLTLVEDGGRRGLASIGVPRSGAADPTALRLANRLVGNPEGAAALEVTVSGPALRSRCEQDLLVALVGEATLWVDARPVEPNTVVPLGPGQLLTIGATARGLRAYLGVAGGVETPPMFGSHSSDLLAGLGPGPLREGDHIALGAPTRARGRLARPPSSLDTGTLRVLPGPDEFGPRQLEKLTRCTWKVSPSSDRVGVRLTGEALSAPAETITSRAMVSGALQVPPDGMPIALLCDHATLGGYPVAATVIGADLGRLGQLRPGDSVRFELVDLPGALAALRELERELDRQVAGWYPSRVD